MAWIYLFAAGLLECTWSATMKMSEGFSKFGYSLATIIALAGSMALLILATKTLPIALAYPIWTGIGAAGSIIIGATVFKEHIPPMTWIFVVFLLIGVIGIKLTSGE
ncbi:QacE family quaternary ammonium compound efflux SMR transporter [Lactobacillus nasalidis]|uniref:QacE family quaternary ammonium compound efflux SMR transporter n=1 Tax=Lactobacillus nasalidis TaxID=2797258 RepID=A0ABQ3W379_9LACO|nr:multidrug efflux SMR transporter [Lactobacillus nasalidis]GHV97176.1 QacE family quaternary ammonium compound efflux SMR transporter [Lactobacillus nasalidis]GHV98933.1 QacE family quaternary ammonium compound efflux SMR transporter [Lactobacillus nasalidis]GHW00841.1 QacE family quaternary ammonium compound efflux SMR transporter [Lactobacillus nasalidis]